MKCEIIERYNLYCIALRDSEHSSPMEIDIPRNAPLSVFFDAVRELERGYIEGSRGNNGDV